MAKVFIDDSGSSPADTVIYIRGWVGKVEVWDSFANEWSSVLSTSNPKPIKYFKHFESRSLSGCFAGFTDEEATEKMQNLAEVIANHDIYGIGFAMAHEYQREMLKKYALTIRGKVAGILQDPFFFCMNALICWVLGKEYEQNPNEKVDFIFDGKPESKQVNLLVGMFENHRDYFMPEPYRSIMGTAIPMNDKDVMPLQAADFLVGQERLCDLLNPSLELDQAGHRPL